MPRKDAKRALDPGSPGSEDSPGRRLSRRSLLQAAGVAGLAATALGSAAGPALAATSRPPTGPPTRPQGHGASAGPVAAGAGPIVVHVRDTRSGDIEVFAGTRQTRVRDADLAARIAGVIG
jgi:hypothetical protein